VFQNSQNLQEFSLIAPISGYFWPENAIFAPQKRFDHDKIDIG
jgi:hypothetical protein